MVFAAFDTFKFTKRLEDAGISRAHAEAFSSAFREAQQESNLATKDELQAMELRITRRFAGMLAVAVLIIVMVDVLL